MAKYWKESGSAEAKLLYVVSADAEVDEWHPASDPPKTEDFKPTGWIQILCRNGFAPPLCIKMYPGCYYDWTHWRKISIPKT